jgi:hypothetical protein
LNPDVCPATPGREQKSHFEPGASAREARIDELRDKVGEKFGRKALVRASHLGDAKGS